jgi:hypothetical protein
MRCGNTFGERGKKLTAGGQKPAQANSSRPFYNEDAHLAPHV